MLEHLKIFGLIINLIVGSVISLYIFQIYKTNKYTYIKALGFYTLLFNLAYLILLFYSYLSINLPNDVFKQSLSKYDFLNEFFVSVFAICLLLFAYQIYLGFIGKAFSTNARWIFVCVLIFLFASYILRFVIANKNSFLWLDFLFKYIFENLLLLELILLILLIIKNRKSNRQNRIARAFGILYILRYLAILILFAYILSVGYNETVKAVFGFSFLLILNLLPLFWIRFYFIPFTKQNININSENKFKEYCVQFDVSQREKDILKLIIDGKSNKEISNMLFISYSTVKNHVYNLFQKLNISSRFELISNFNNFLRNK
ncbi:MAG: helix-turn-helix transcriptional regulator [Bacteroidales bacterium]|nr:helix-turn-helix transcriptional regulator [Bacteroidales bacterium]